MVLVAMSTFASLCSVFVLFFFKFVGAFKARREAEAKAKQEAEEKAKREAEEQRVADACAAMGCPMGSKWCLNSSNDVITGGEVGTVVGFLHGQGKVLVKFRKVTWPLAPDRLSTPEAWREREAVRF